jgi:hypothetical protein
MVTDNAIYIYAARCQIRPDSNDQVQSTYFHLKAVPDSEQLPAEQHCRRTDRIVDRRYFPSLSKNAAEGPIDARDSPWEISVRMAMVMDIRLSRL